jgi:hypothetical protein
MQKNIFVVALMTGSIMLIATGCGANVGNQTNNPITPTAISANNLSLNMYQVKNQGITDTSTGDEKKKYLDDELTKAVDEVSTEQAIRDFYNYTSSRDNDVKNSKTISDADIKKLAQKEISDKKAPKITPEKLAKKINKLAKETGANKITEKEVELVQTVVRNQMPHITSNPNNEAMSPFEAMVVTYALVTGDDGNAKPGSMKVNMTQNQINTFINDILTDKED